MYPSGFFGSNEKTSGTNVGSSTPVQCNNLIVSANPQKPFLSVGKLRRFVVVTLPYILRILSHFLYSVVNN